MFANMLGPTAIDVAGIGALGQALIHREDEDARRSDIWREEVAQRLQAELTTLDSLAHGFAPDAASRRPANRSTAPLGLAKVAIAVLAVVLGIAIFTVLGLGGGSAAPPSACLHDKTVCRPSDR